MIYSAKVKRKLPKNPGDRRKAVLKRVAVFDYDHTLITGDSFLPYLINVAGRMHTYKALLGGLCSAAISLLIGTNVDGWRTHLKAYLLKNLLAGKRYESLAHAATETRQWQTEKDAVMLSLREHADRGDIIVIASGGLNLYLPELLRGVPYQALICTDIGVENGVITGAMIHGNCVRLRKAERVAQWLAANGPFDESYGYGNAPHDLPMLELVQHRVVVT